MAKPGRATKGIGKRIGTLVAYSVFAAVLAAAIALAFLQTHKDIASKRSSLETTGYVLASSVANALLESDKVKTKETLSSVSRIPDIRTLSVIDANGKVFASMGQTTFLENDFAANPNLDIEMLLKGVMPVAVDIVKGGKTVGRVVMLADIQDVQWNFLNTLISTFLAALAAAVAGLVVSRPLQERIVTPVVELTRSMTTIRNTRNYAHNINGTSAVGEVAMLVDSFNSLMSDIRFRDNSLQKLAYFDPLTGLSNRVGFRSLLEQWLEETGEDKQRGTVVLFNIHGFRSMNDAFGHSIGDAILLSAAALAKDTAGESIQMARVGGDEFALLAKEATTRAEAEHLIATIQSAFYAPLKILELELHVMLTAGAVLLPAIDSLDDGAAGILRCADLALNAAKEAGAGRAVFYMPSMSITLRAETELGQALRFAIKNNELEVHYQPQYDFGKNCITGFEALLRWTHPTVGNIPPSRFIPVAEQTGQIVPLGDWILREVCSQARRWLDEGVSKRLVSVNVSPAQILDAGFVAKVKSALDDARLPPGLLCLELTESLFLGPSMKQVQEIMNELSAIGVCLALDDFGTGYSSLGYLAKLPFDVLKIDRSFVSKVDQSERRREILRSVIVMAHSLGMRVVAEGAETEAEFNVLQTLEADKVQGYCIARPMPEAEALAQARQIDLRIANSQKAKSA